MLPIEKQVIITFYEEKISSEATNFEKFFLLNKNTT
jgi:hypothetical protein